MRILATLCLLVAACQDAAAPVGGDAPVTCKTDDECNVACGPCTSGDVIKASDRTLGCAVNPCPGTVTICGADHKCRVK
jgi:hypothetical protein